MEYLPTHATIEQACTWLHAETDQNWILARLLEAGLTPWFWLDYTSTAPPEIFCGRVEGYLALMVFGGDTSRLQADGTNAIVNMTRNAEGKLLKIEPGLRVPLSDLRFKREQLQDLVQDLCGDRNGETAPHSSDLPGTVLNLPANTAHLRFGHLPELIAGALWPMCDDSDELRSVTYFGACQNLERELYHAAKAGTLPVLDPLTFGPHTLLIGASLKKALVSVDALQKYLGSRLSIVVSSQVAEAPKSQAVPESEVLVKPMQRSAAQDAEILAALRRFRYDPLALPANKPGKPGVKAEIEKVLSSNRNPLFLGSTVFAKAWERLRRNGDIVMKA